ncbi:NAD-dependent epimerase/dehydratase family protein [Desulfobacterium sp. N47]|uniref:NAD-dependent epimerase/dehydratase family protein n=1 Tax=Desulfobacterium sp. N47 TaxID=3115210 RepID=UPI003F4A268C
MILILGGTGYIGSHANKLFNWRGYKTVVFDNLIYGHSSFVKWGDFFLVILPIRSFRCPYFSA